MIFFSQPQLNYIILLFFQPYAVTETIKTHRMFIPISHWKLNWKVKVSHEHLFIKSIQRVVYSLGLLVESCVEWTFADKVFFLIIFRIRIRNFSTHHSYSTRFHFLSTVATTTTKAAWIVQLIGSTQFIDLNKIAWIQPNSKIDIKQQKTITKKSKIYEFMLLHTQTNV